MTELDRREEGTGGGVLNDLLQVANAPASPAVVEKPVEEDTSSSQPLPVGQNHTGETSEEHTNDVAPVSASGTELQSSEETEPQEEQTNDSTSVAASDTELQNSEQTEPQVDAAPVAEPESASGETQVVEDETVSTTVSELQNDELTEPQVDVASEIEPEVASAETVVTEEPVLDAPSTTDSEPVQDYIEPVQESTEPVQESTESEAATMTDETPTTSVAESVAVTPKQQKSTEKAEASFTPKETNTRPRRLKDLAAGMELDGRVTSVALYGVFVDIGLGRDGLVHISEMSEKRIESPSELVNIGDAVKVRVKKVDLDDRRISLTMRPAREEVEEQQPRVRFKRPDPDREALAKLKVGDLVQGKVTGMAPFGAFIDIGVGKDGLVHISELSENRVEKPEDAVAEGDQYTFKVLEVDPEGTRISLSLRRAQRAKRMQQLSSGDIIEGSISGLAPFGAFVDIGVGRDGLVHISQLSSNRVEKVEDVVKVGETISVRVLEVDTQSKRISLSMKLEPDPEPEPEPAETSSASPDGVATAAPEPQKYAKYEKPDRTASEDAKSSPSQRQQSSSRGEGRRSRERDKDRDNRRGGDRDGRGKGGRQRGSRDNRDRAAAHQSGSRNSSPVQFYATSGDEPEEEFEGNATLQDLLTKFGGSNAHRNKNKRRREFEEEEEDDGDTEGNRFHNRKKQRDAIQRTLQHSNAMDDE